MLEGPFKREKLAMNGSSQILTIPTFSTVSAITYRLNSQARSNNSVEATSTIAD